VHESDSPANARRDGHAEEPNSEPGRRALHGMRP
jgi:hypothetical protein